MNIKVKVTRLDKPLLAAANVNLKSGLYSIYFSVDRKEGFVVGVIRANIGDEVVITEGPTKDIGSGIITEIMS